jgi:hypothetical protein
MVDAMTVYRPAPCAECGGDFTPRRATARFCSAACRLAAHRRLGVAENPGALPIHQTAIIRQNPGKIPQQNQWPVKCYFSENENTGPATIGAAKRAAEHMLEFGVTPYFTDRFKAATAAFARARALR